MAAKATTFDLDGVKWDKVKVLGKGSFGEAILVKRADKPDVLAVCKRVQLSGMKPEERREAINEVNVIRRLRHPNIVEYYGSFEQDDVLHIFMEFANSGDVEGLIKEQVKTRPGEYLDETLIASLLVQMTCALKYLHERHILHRDLKAQNVFLSRKRPGGPLIVKIGDFGISTVLRNTHAMAKTVCGTPYYFSPELCLNRPYNSKTDVWSLGCILYELAALKHVFDAQNMKALVARILKGTYTPLPSKYSPDMSLVLDLMLQQKADRRLDVAGVLNSAWMKRHVAALCSNDLMRTITANIAVMGALSAAAIPAVAPKAFDPRSDAVAKAKSGASGAPGACREEAARANALPLLPAAQPRVRAEPVDPAKAKAEQARIRREAIEAAEAERRRGIEEERRQRNLRHDVRSREQDAMRRQKLTDLDEIRARVELQTYEEQQVFVQKGWQELEKVSDRQDERERQAKQRDEHLARLKQQMNEIENKMRGRRDEGPCVIPLAPTAADAQRRPSSQGVTAAPVAVPDRAQVLWEEERRKIEAARAAAVASGKPSADAAWQEQQRRIDAARQHDYALQQAHRQPQPASAFPPAPPVVEPAWLQEDFAQGSEDVDFARVMACVNEVAKQPAVAADVAAPSRMFEERALPANDVSRLENFVKFTLDGKTLHLKNAKATDPIARRVEALGAFIAEALGGPEAFSKLYSEIDYIQGCDADDDTADGMLHELELSYGSKGKYVDLMVQYLCCVAMHGLQA